MPGQSARWRLGGRVRSASTAFGATWAYAIGALSAGIIADLFGMAWAIGSIATLTFLSGVVVIVLMRERAGRSLDLAQDAEPIGQ